MIQQSDQPYVGQVKLCPSCKQLSLKVLQVYPPNPTQPDPDLRYGIIHWRCFCGYAEYV